MLLGLGVVPMIPSIVDYCGTVVAKGECSVLPGCFAITPNGRFQVDIKDCKEITRSSLPLQMLTDHPTPGIIVFGQHNTSASRVVQQCCCCCSPCTHKREPWDLESLATLASVLPREM